MATGSGFLSGHSLSLSAFKVLLFWLVRSRFADLACFTVGVDGVEYVRARFPSTEGILEQCNLCCVLFRICAVGSAESTGKVVAVAGPSSRLFGLAAGRTPEIRDGRVLTSNIEQPLGSWIALVDHRKAHGGLRGCISCTYLILSHRLSNLAGRLLSNALDKKADLMESK